MKERTKQRIEQLREMYNQTEQDDQIESDAFRYFTSQDKLLMSYIKGATDEMWSQFIEAMKKTPADPTVFAKRETTPAVSFDWSCLPAWCNSFIAMDNNGEWYAYKYKPEVLGNQFTLSQCDLGTALYIPTEYFPKNFTGDWKDSLMNNRKKHWN